MLDTDTCSFVMTRLQPLEQLFRATDTTPERQVAIEILPPSLEADAARLARVRCHAHVLAAPICPDIAAIDGLKRSRAIGLKRHVEAASHLRQP